jgi:hypothetical protein
VSPVSLRISSLLHVLSLTWLSTCFPIRSLMAVTRTPSEALSPTQRACSNLTRSPLCSMTPARRRSQLPPQRASSSLFVMTSSLLAFFSQAWISPVSHACTGHTGRLPVSFLRFFPSLRPDDMIKIPRQRSGHACVSVDVSASPAGSQLPGRCVLLPDRQST